MIRGNDGVGAGDAPWGRWEEPPRECERLPRDDGMREMMAGLQRELREMKQ